MRDYFLQVEEVDWNFTPLGKNGVTGDDFTDDENVFVQRVDTADVCRVGAVYKKLRYVEYSDAGFVRQVVQPESHGIQGPTLRAIQGDVIRVTLKNAASVPVTLHPHGVPYTKEHEGALADDGTPASAKKDDRVEPGATYTYIWHATSGPGSADVSSIVFAYHSHADEIADPNAGLFGAIVIADPRCADEETARALDVDREFVLVLNVMDENVSPLLDANIAEFCPAFAGDVDELKGDDDFGESNLMHAMNGFVYGNLGGLTAVQHERVRWHLIGIGTEVDIHTIHWHGNVVDEDGHTRDVVELFPMTFRSVDMVAENAGKYLIHCHVHDHLSAGMNTFYLVAAKN
jgi:FtsP/CotA-like multicopper oxidase with cupredoxin domain